MELGFQILAVILAGIAAYFYWIGESERTLVTGNFAACSFFISYRFRVKARLDANKPENEDILRK